MSAVNQTVAQRLSEHLAQLGSHSSPDDVLTKAGELILDQLGCQLIGSTMSWNAIVYDFIRGFAGGKESTVVKYGLKTWAHDAAFINATFGQGCELDDVMEERVGHAGAICVPVALALGERDHANGKTVIAAILAGYETMRCLGRPIASEMLTRGFHIQSTIGVFVAAAVAARLLRLDISQTAQAFAIAGSHACGTLEFDQSGGEVKRVHSGLAARGGIHSAMLAKGGLTGPLTIFEGKRGILPLFAGQNDPSPILEGLEQDPFGFQYILLKTYPVAGSIQSPIGLLAHLIQSHDVKASAIERIDVGVNERTLLRTAAIYEPRDTVTAQYSLPFSLAIRLLKGSNDLNEYKDSDLWQDTEVLELSRKVHCHSDTRFTGEKYHGSHVKVTLTDGSTFEAQEDYPRGSPHNPLTHEEIIDKFRCLASSVLPSDRIENVIETVCQLDALEDVAKLVSLLY